MRRQVLVHFTSTCLLPIRNGEPGNDTREFVGPEGRRGGGGGGRCSKRPEKWHVSLRQVCQKQGRPHHHHKFLLTLKVTIENCNVRDGWCGVRHAAHEVRCGALVGRACVCCVAPGPRCCGAAAAAAPLGWALSLSRLAPRRLSTPTTSLLLPPPAPQSVCPSVPRRATCRRAPETAEGRFGIARDESTGVRRGGEGPRVAQGRSCCRSMAGRWVVAWWWWWWWSPRVNKL